MVANSRSQSRSFQMKTMERSARLHSTNTRRPSEKPGRSDVAAVIREFDFLANAETDERWGFRDVYDALRPYYEKTGIPRPRPDTLSHKNRTFRDRITNNTIERIGVRYIEWKLSRTELPTQFSLGGGPGERDIAFTLQDKLIASGNAKLFLQQRHTELHVTPECRDPVHYVLLIRVKPFSLKIYRGPGKEIVTEGELKDSALDLGWAGFLQDLRREAEKKAPAQATPREREASADQAKNHATT
jgi:hypothetical protein